MAYLFDLKNPSDGFSCMRTIIGSPCIPSKQEKWCAWCVTGSGDGLRGSFTPSPTIGEIDRPHIIRPLVQPVLLLGSVSSSPFSFFSSVVLALMVVFHWPLGGMVVAHLLHERR